jgi:hypothetical protein
LAATDAAVSTAPGLAGSAAVELALRLTLLDLLLRPIGDEWLRPLLLGLAAAGLVFPSTTLRPWLWACLATLTGLRVVLDYPLSDNHAYLLGYWCLALALASRSRDPGAFVAWNARHLVGLVFAFAVLWKLVLSPDFLDGTFFRVSLVTDPRFADLARWLGGFSPDELEAQRAFLLQHADGGGVPAVALVEPPRLVFAARALATWTIAIESAIAVTFLWRRDRGPSRLRDGCLLLFCTTTYAFATVAGFGWLLIAMGVAQTAPERRVVRGAYVVAYALILLYREVRWWPLLLS